MTAPTASECAADPTLCPRCASPKTKVKEYGFKGKRVCLACWHHWELGYPLWPKDVA